MPVPARNTSHRYGSIAMLFHWMIAILIFSNVPLGIYFARFLQRGSPQWFLFAQLHVVIGTIVLALSFLRLGWRLINEIPDHPADSGKGQRVAATSAHYALYTLMIMVPLIGWGLLSLSPRPVLLFGVGPWPKLWFLVSLPDAAKAALAKVLGASHAIGALLLIVLALGHVAAAVFYHHVIKRDQVLRRMTPWTDIEAPVA